MKTAERKTGCYIYHSHNLPYEWEDYYYGKCNNRKANKYRKILALYAKRKERNRAKRDIINQINEL